MASFEQKYLQINRNQFNEVVEENLRLENELLFANKCIETLITFKSFVDLISNKFKNNLNSNEWQKFEKLRKDVEEVLKSKDEFIEQMGTKITPTLVPSEELIGIDEYNYEEGVGHRLENDNSFEQRLNFINKKSEQNEINSNNGIHSSEDNMKTTKNLYSNNEMTTKALNKSNITYNRRKQSNNCSQNTGKSDDNMNESTEEMTDPTTTQTIKTEIISNDKTEENSENIKFEYLSQNVKDFENTYNSLNLSESQFSTKDSNNKQNIGFVDTNVGSKKCLDNSRVMQKQIILLIGPKLEVPAKINIQSSTVDTSEEKFSCNLCNKEFQFRKALITHMSNHFDIKCHICGKVFKNKDRMSRHKQSMHFVIPSFECDHPGCGKKFKYRPNLRIHKNTVHSSVDQKYECNQCNKVFRHQNGLKLHKLYIHSENLLACNWPGCQYRAKYKQYIENHQKTHRPERNYVCDWPECGKAFKVRNCLTTHMKTHTSSEIFTCDWPGCEYTCRIRNRLTAHRKVHSSERKYVCDWPECGKAFTRADAFKTHKNRHTREKLYPCDWPGCQYTSTVSSYVKKHKIAKHIKN